MTDASIPVLLAMPNLRYVSGAHRCKMTEPGWTNMWNVLHARPEVNERRPKSRHYYRAAAVTRWRAIMRFSIRDLLWATALVAMGLGWLLDRTFLEQRLEQSDRQHEIEKDKLRAAHETEMALLRSIHSALAPAAHRR